MTPGWLRVPAVVAAGSAPFLSVLVLDPNVGGHYPSCPFRRLLSVDCPGCGSLRGLHDLAHGDVVGALDHNALLVPVLVLVGVELARWAVGRAPSRVVRWRHAPVVALAVVSAWALVRNIPVVPFEVLASGAAG